MRIALDDHFFGDLYGPHLRNATHIVAGQIDQHDVLCDFLGVGEQLLRKSCIFLWRFAPRPGTGNGTQSDQWRLALDLILPHQNFWG